MKHSFTIPYRLLCLGWVGIMVAATALPLQAQRTQPGASVDDYVYWGSPATYLNNQAKVAYPLIDRMLDAYPPAKEVDKHRQMALVTLDQFLHDADYQRRTAFYTFINNRLNRVSDKMDKAMLSGVRIYKLYNSGFILKTKKTTIAIDLVPGGTTAKPFLTDSALVEIVNRCDALLVTNSDNSHANRAVAKMFVDLGKQVLAPQGLWTKLGDEILNVGGDTTQVVKLDKMTVNVLPGHYGNTSNNIYVIDLLGCGIIAHTGAQDNDNDWAWIDRLHDQYNVDILLTKSQNTRLEAMLKGFQPRVVITSHENEMESSVDKRDSYWATQKRLKRLTDLSIPNVIMTWGETYEYADSESENISSSANKVYRDGRIYIERKGTLYTPSGIKVN